MPDFLAQAHDPRDPSPWLALYLDQSFVLAHFALANLARQRGQAREAARHLENAASLLAEFGDEDILPGSEGMSARRLGEIIAATRGSV